MQCTNCALRFPVLDDQNGDQCPHCGANTAVVLDGFLDSESIPEATRRLGPRIEALLDNVRSAWNVGAMFRTADGAGIARLHLCGITPTPPHDGISKTALGAEEAVLWSYHKNAISAARQLTSEGHQLWALERTRRAVPLSGMPELSPDDMVALVVGNEITGVDRDLLDLCKQVVLIPMLGAKRSLNAAVAFGIAAYSLTALQRTGG